MKGRDTGIGTGFIVLALLAVLAGCASSHDEAADAGLLRDVTPSTDGRADATDGQGSRFIQVSTITNTTCALRSDGVAACWGKGFVGEPLILEDIDQVAAGTLHGCFIRDGALECATSESHVRPECHTNVPDGRFTDVASTVFNCALDEAGQVVCWGCDEEYLPPPTDEPLSNLTLSGSWACALTPEGAPVCWMIRCCVEPPEVTAEALRHVEPGSIGICGLTPDGEVECWSEDRDWLEEMADHPAGPFEHLSTSQGTSACALRPDGELVCWGRNYDFGDQEPEGLRYRDVALGTQHACAITLEGELVCWGSNEWNQATPPELPP